MDNNTVSLRRRHKGNMGEFQYKKLLKDIQIEINKAFTFAKNSKFPDVKILNKYIYSV